jgi:ABC-type branched-subunit amino acid transport system substrate-binding protein
VLLAAGVTLAACSAGDDGAGPGTTTTTEVVAPTPCPVGDPVPRAGPDRYGPAVPLEDGEVAPAGEPGELVVGTLLPRSGDLAFLGAAPLAAVERAVRDLNEAGGVLGAPVRLLHGDSAEGSPGAAEAEVDRLLDDGATVVIGPLSSAVAAAVLDRVTAAGGVLVTPGAAAGSLDRLDTAGRLFRTIATERLQGQALAELVLADGPAVADLVVRDDDHGRTLAAAFETAFTERGGSIGTSVLRDPAAPVPDLDAITEGGGEATVLVGLADTAPVIDALAAGGRAPDQHPTYGTEGALGERLADLVGDPSSLTCLRGLLATAPTGDQLAQDLAEGAPALAGGVVLDHAAEAYDAVLVAALAAEAAGAADGTAIADAVPAVTGGEDPCDSAASCLEAVRGGAEVDYHGRSGRLHLGREGNRREAILTLVAFDASAHLARLGPWRVEP